MTSGERVRRDRKAARPTKSAKIRALAARDISREDIESRLGVSRATIRSVLRQRTGPAPGPVGRPPLTVPRESVLIRVSAVAATWLRRTSRLEGCTLGELVEQCVQDAVGYRIVIEWSNEDRAFIARMPALTGAAAHGDTPFEAAKQLCEAALGIVESMQAHSKAPAARKTRSKRKPKGSAGNPAR